MWSETIQRLLNEENLLVGISELSELAEVSPRQLRYWEAKGYITSVAKSDNTARKYQLPMVIKVHWIKRFLDEGYTLQRAAEKAAQQKRTIAIAKKIFSQTFHGISDICDGFVALDLGSFDEAGTQKLYVLFNEHTEKSRYVVLPASDDIVDFVKSDTRQV
ncbi:MerR family transcriptional regulator [Enterococcus faecalis]